MTTAIDFPNAAPHMGHVYEKILADTVVRRCRLQGDDVRFHLGTDENGMKIQQTAKELGVSPRELVDRNVPAFRNLFQRLGISFDYFIRTADAQNHWPTVTALWKKLQAAGFLERRTYTGLYCTGCECFWRSQDLVDGQCPDHRRVPEEVAEENWFFLLSRQQKKLRKLLHPTTGSYRIVPPWRAKETMNFLEGGLEDVSFSRSKQTLFWGVPVPDDPDQVMYVWCDNLTSYISSLGYFQSCTCPCGPVGVACHERGTQCRVEWWDDAEVTHVIGKDIARFHAINWPAMLQAVGLRTPDRLLIHGFITSDGQKMSKSIGNVVDPVEVLDRYGVDALRFYLMHEISVGNDGDFSWKRFGELYKSKLADQIGNLLNRVLVLFRKDGGRFVDGWPQQCLGGTMDLAWEAYEKSFVTFEIDSSLRVSLGIVERCNAQMQLHEVWAKPPSERIQYLTEFAEALRHVSLMLLPFIPETAQKMSKQLGLPYVDRMLERDFVINDAMKQWGGCKDWKSVGEPRILFPKVE